MKLDGKVAIVSGGARGLGGATARLLAEAGAAVVLGDVLDEVGEGTAADLRDAGHKAIYMHLDVRSADDWAAIISRATDAFGKIDILVNNAGVTAARTIEDATIEEFQRMIDINLLGVFRGMQAVIPAMKAAGRGSIVNISSNSTQKVLALTTIYSPTKAAVANLTKTAAAHLAQYGIRVNSIHPGPHATEMLLGGEAHATEQPLVRALIEAIPMKRMGNPGEVGAAVAFLASDDASYITGAELFVDGGLTMV